MGIIPCIRDDICNHPDPSAIVEGVIIALVFKYIIAIRPDILVKLKVLPQSLVDKIRESQA